MSSNSIESPHQPFFRYKTEPETETVACLLMKMEKSDFGKTERYEKKDNYTSLVSDRL